MNLSRWEMIWARDAFSAIFPGPQGVGSMDIDDEIGRHGDDGTATGQAVGLRVEVYLVDAPAALVHEVPANLEVIILAGDDGVDRGLRRRPRVVLRLDGGLDAPGDREPGEGWLAVGDLGPCYGLGVVDAEPFEPRDQA